MIARKNHTNRFPAGETRSAQNEETPQPKLALKFI